MGRLFIKLVLALMSLSFAFEANARHLVGGHMGYEHIEETAEGNHVYRITLEMYRDCHTSDVPFDDVIQIGVYEDDGNNALIEPVVTGLDGEEAVEPPFAEEDSDCDFEPDVCIRKGWYEEEIILPPSSEGYHLIHRRCCRNDDALVNLIDNMGNNFYAFIPPTDYEDSSPTFQEDPIPFKCQGVLTNLDNEAVDPDGDSLSYHFHQPFTGGTRNTPAPDPPPFLSFPLDQVIYSQGYGPDRPFGAAGEANIFNSTGLTQLEAPNTGFYAIGVEVRSYRDGEHISSLYRDMQIIVIDCPQNPVPEINEPTVGGEPREEYEIEAGETLEFDFEIEDPGNNDLEFDYFGEVFGDIEGAEPPYASIDAEVDGPIVDGNFQWETDCDQGREEPYIFTIEAADDGCPPQTLIHNYEITVNDLDQPGDIQGPDLVCQYGEEVASYSVVPGDSDQEAHWDVEGGTVVDQNDTEIEVRWDEGPGTVTYWEENEFGCETEIKEQEVEVVVFPESLELTDLEFCSTEEVLVGFDEAEFDERLSFSWEPNEYVENDDSATATLDYTRADLQNPVNELYTLQVYYEECTLEFEKDVTVLPGLESSPVLGPREACQGDRYSYTYEVREPAEGVDYFWEGDEAEIREDYNDSIEVTFPEGDIQFVRLSGENEFGCRADTTQLPVDVSESLVDSIRGPTVVCPNNQGISYEVDPTHPESDLYWEVEGGKIAEGQGDSVLFVDWGEPGEAEVSVVEELPDGCVGDTVSLDVLLDYELDTSPIMGPDSICANQEESTYYVFETENSHYEWEVENAEIIEGQGDHEIRVEWDEPGKAELSVLETSFDPVNEEQCIGDWVEKDVRVFDAPDAFEFPEPFRKCEGDTTTLKPDNIEPGFEYHWELSDASYFVDQDSQITFSYDEPGDFDFEMYMVNSVGCTSIVSREALEVTPRPSATEIVGDTAICDEQETITSHKINGMENSSYEWEVMNGEIINRDKGEEAEEVTVDWDVHGKNEVSVREISEYGCEGPVNEQAVYVDLADPEMDYVTTLPDDDSRIEVNWTLNNDDFFDRYYSLMRQNHSELNGDDLEPGLVDSFSYPPSRAEDPFVETSENSYHYQVDLSNLCGDNLNTDFHRSILLEGEKDKPDISLNWNDYEGWDDEISGYTLYRKVNEEEYYWEFADFGLEKDENRETFDVLEDGYRQCYRVKAEHGSKGYESWSNEVCFEFEATLHIPNAFSPESEPNEKFRIEGFNLKDYRLSIYNRWGERIFESKNIDEGWDGTLDGERVPEGSYMYIVEYETLKGKRSESGTLTLIR